MNKLMLSGFVIFSFIAYSLHGRRDGRAVVIAPPAISTEPSTPAPTDNSGGTSPAQTTATTSTGVYKDGQYTGTSEDAYYGYVQVKATVSGGKLTNVQFLQYPNDRSTSVQINSQAMPYLKQEAIQAQSAQVDTISGATYTSEAFVQSLGAALSKAKS